MTHDILLTDIELAKTMLSESRTDDEIVRALSLRGVDPAQAARLIDDLHNGRAVQPQVTAPEMQWARDAKRRHRASRSESHSTPNVSRNETPSAPQVSQESSSRPHRRSGSPSRSKLDTLGVVLAIVFLACLAIVAAYIYHKRHIGVKTHSESIESVRPPKSP